MNRSFRMTLMIALIALITSVAAPALAGTWTIDPHHSVMNFKVRHIFSKAGGSFDDWAGTLEFDGKDPATLAANVTIQAASINTGNDDRDKHLRSADFFDVEKYPTITFVSKKAEKRGDDWYLVGDFTMRGVTKEIAIEFEFDGSGKNPWGNNVAGFSADLEINRKDFGIEWNKTLDAGGMLLGDEVSIDLEIEASEASDAN